MTDVPRRGLADVDTSVPNVARMNDYLLGGKDNFAADRKAVDSLLAIAPEIREIALENRLFLRRAVRFLAEQGIRQFIDIGSGLPTQRNSHEIARSVTSDARVVYVEKDPVVLSHARAILIDSSRTAVVEGDILHPEEFLTECGLHGLIDLQEPLALVVCGSLHFIPHSDDPFKSVAWLRDAVPSGSHLAITHVVFDTRPDVVEPIEEIYRAILDRPGETAARTRDQVLPFFDGFELVDPGLVYVREWRPENPLAARSPEKAWMLGGVGRKP
ncbi:SAM-dependent methyltransferase [Actinoallomurus sp. NPDC052274]|uniref:SAM-dependent methyltransferase n=1 Tax=Actinoallomurus sp. NPDC052274 TaxID=3155420 RepID=UPI00341AE21D